METYRGIAWMIGVLGAVFGIVTLRRHIEFLINFVLRGVLGLFFIYFGNCFLAEMIPELTLGYNLINFFTSGLLGVPGIMMLYGIRFYTLW